MPCHDGEGLRWVVAAVLAREPDVSWRGCWMTMSWSGPGRWSVMSWSSCPGWRGATKLGFALLLRFYAVHGRFPTGRGEIPDQAVAHVARLADVPPDELGLYEWDGRTIKAHRADVRKYFGFRSARSRTRTRRRNGWPRTCARRSGRPTGSVRSCWRT